MQSQGKFHSFSGNGTSGTHQMGTVSKYFPDRSGSGTNSNTSQNVNAGGRNVNSSSNMDKTAK